MNLIYCIKFAALISTYSARYNVDPQIAHRVMFAESGCHASIRNSRVGCVGLMQICRGVATTGKHQYADRQLRNPRLNIRLGIRRIARAMRLCGPDPSVYLGNYAGLKCGPSSYARRVLYGGRGVYDSETSGPPAESGLSPAQALKWRQ